MISTSRRKIYITAAVIFVIALLILSFFPYREFIEPDISVNRGYSSANLTGNLSGVSINSPIKFGINGASTSINDGNFPESFLNISLNGLSWHNGPPFGGYPGNESSGVFYIWVNLTVAGHLAPNLDPMNLVLETNASGPDSLGYITSSGLASEFTGVNATQDWTTSFAGYNSSSAEFSFNNEPKLSIFGNYPHSFYNFEIHTVFLVMIASYSGTHDFGYSAELTGLRQAASVGITLILIDN
ncbi:MAG: hypothetical protein B2I17_04400 [Thermoplasmatales archaeon B_DKE]|nr:MAG: hypothetical protein B2I17_04400 [Thermoplasmatales archaeon B_DKE]QRF75707.1 hypothetical protein Thermo_01213 [Thermoplasmatales archaeon]